MKKAFDWFVMSSKNPEKVGLTVKSLLAFGLLFGIDSSVADEGAGHIVNLIVALGMLASAGKIGRAHV